MGDMKAQPPSDAQPKHAQILISGAAGVGKTMWALDWPDAYVIDSEGGATRPQYVERMRESGTVVLGPQDGAGEFSTVLAEVRSLVMEEHDRRTLVIDSFTKIFQNEVAKEEERLSAKGKAIEFGIERKPAIKLSRRLVHWLGRLQMNVVLICHEKPKWQNGQQVGEDFDGWSKLEYELDLWLQVRMDTKGQRFATIRKTRIDAFPLGDSFLWDFSEFKTRYGAEAIELPSAPIGPATEDQVERICELLSEKKVPPETRSQWLEKAAVDHWSQMDGRTIQKCIDHLEAKK